MSDEDLPIITESAFNQQFGFGGDEDLPMISESHFNKLSSPVVAQAPEAPSFFSDPIGAIAGTSDWSVSNLVPNLTSADWWMTRPSGEKISAAQGVAGPLLALNNAVNPIGDETVAAGSAIGDAIFGGPGYDARLAQAREMEKSFEEASPAASLALDIYGATRLPTKFGTALEPATGLGRTGQALKEAAGYGALFGFGNAEGGAQERINSGLRGGALSALLGGSIVGTAEGARGLLKVGDYFPGITKLLSNTPENEAGNILKTLGGDDVLKVVDDIDNPLSQYRTLAEATQNPKLAQLEQSLTKEGTEANALLNANLQNRRAAQKVIFDKISSQPAKTVEAGGQVIRELIEPRAAQAKKAMEELFEAVDPNGIVPLKDIRRNFVGLVKKSYEAGGVPSDIKGLVQELNSSIPTKKTVMKQGAGFGAEATPEVVEQLVKPASRPYSYIKSLRERAQEAWIKAKNNGDTRAASVANKLVRGIDSAVEEAGRVGTMTADDVAKFKEAKRVGSEYFDVFGHSGVGPIINKVKDGQYISKASKIVSNTFDGSPEGTRKILRAIGDAPEEVDKARGAIRDHLFRLGSDNDGNLRPGKLRTILRKYEEGLTAKLPNGKSLFEDDHLKALSQLSDELALVDTQSVKSVKQLANTASIGQPTTAQALMMQGLAKSVLGNTIGRFDEWLVQGVQQKADDLLARAMVDKKLARDLVSRATPSRISRILQPIDDGLGALPKKVFAPVIGSRTAGKEEDKSSSNYTTDPIERALNKAEASLMESKPPEIISVKRVPKGENGNIFNMSLERAVNTPIDESEKFLAKVEGGQQLKAYPPPAKGSGVTVATGVDLGQWSKEDLQKAGVSSKTIQKVNKYLGKKDALAKSLLREKPLELKKEEAEELDSAIKNDIFQTVDVKFKNATGQSLEKLPPEAQTVVKSLAYNFGKNLDNKIPTIWKAIVNKDWEKVQTLLQTTKWKQPELKNRRIQEAKLLDNLIRIA